MRLGPVTAPFRDNRGRGSSWDGTPHATFPESLGAPGPERKVSPVRSRFGWAARFHRLGGAALLSIVVASCSISPVPGPSAAAIPWRAEEGPAPGESLPPLLDRIVDFCDIRSIEEGREFRLRAVYVAGFEVSDLVTLWECSPGRFWVEFSAASRKDSNNLGVLAKIPPDVAMVVVLRGSYRCSKATGLFGGYGHDGAYKCQFTVSALERVVGQLPWPPEQ